MTQLSTRYLWPLLAMLLVSAVPVTAHYIVRVSNDQCKNPEALKRMAIPGVTEAAEYRNHYSPELTQFTRGKMNGARFVWVRTTAPQPFYADRPYHTPGRWTDGPSQLHRFQADGVEIPIRVWEQSVESSTEITATMMIYRDRPVENLFEEGLANALDTMFSGPRVLNFVGITGATHRSETVAARLEMMSFLAEAWTYYLRTCEID